MTRKSQGHFILDIDGVLLDIVSTACDVLNKHFPPRPEDKPLEPRNIITWDWEYCLSFPSSYWTEFWQELWSLRSFPYEGANEFLAALRGMGFKPVGLSNRPEKWKGLVPEDLARQAAERDNRVLDLDYIIYVEDHAHKNQVAREMWPDARFSVEDSPKNARDLGDIDHIETSYLLDRPWNKGCLTVSWQWTRVRNYKDLISDVSHKLILE